MTRCKERARQLLEQHPVSIPRRLRNALSDDGPFQPAQLLSLLDYEYKCEITSRPLQAEQMPLTRPRGGAGAAIRLVECDALTGMPIYRAGSARSLVEVARLTPENCLLLAHWHALFLDPYGHLYRVYDVARTPQSRPQEWLTNIQYILVQRLDRRVLSSRTPSVKLPKGASRTRGEYTKDPSFESMLEVRAEDLPTRTCNLTLGTIKVTFVWKGFFYLNRRGEKLEVLQDASRPSGWCDPFTRPGWQDQPFFRAAEQYKSGWEWKCTLDGFSIDDSSELGLLELAVGAELQLRAAAEAALLDSGYKHHAQVVPRGEGYRAQLPSDRIRVCNYRLGYRMRAKDGG